MEDKQDEGKLFKKKKNYVFHAQGTESKLKSVISFVCMETAKPYQKFQSRNFGAF